MSKSLEDLISGYKKFHKNYITENSAEYRASAAKEQNPKIMVICCSDSRVNPTVLTSAKPGDIFTVHNIANLVPPYECDSDTYHGVSASLEFAVCHLKVDDIIILGHSNCGGIRALMEGVEIKHKENYSFIGPWMRIAKRAKNSVMEKFSGGSFEEQTHHCEKESILISLSNLDSFPWVKRAKERGELETHGWYFNIESGNIEHYDFESKKFKLLNSK